jgi:hypothetical protein
MAWWNSGYKFRRILDISNIYENVETGHYITAPISASFLYERGKTREDYEDVEVIYTNNAATPTYTVLAREITEDGINFYLNDDFDKDDTSSDSYYIYYGNRDLSGAPTRPDFEENLWSVIRSYDDPNFAYTRPGEHWNDGLSSSFGAIATIRTYGERLRLKASIGGNRGIVEISIDDADWEDIDLYSVTTENDYVFSTTSLANGKHRVRFRVTGRANPGSIGVIVGLVQVEYTTPITIEDGGEEIYDFDWASVMSGA